VFGLDARTGDIDWTFGVDGKVSASPIAVVGTTYVVTDTGRLYAIGGSRP
jgi:outer membrane protein assembly factor BamB